MEEIWKIFREGNYEISNHGRARRANAGRGATVGEIMRGSKNKKGYLQFVFYIKGSPKLVLSHRAVVEAFISKIPKNKEVNHIDGNKLNNHVSNLEIVTHSENVRHAHRTGLINPARGIKVKNSKITEDDAIQIRKLYLSGKFQKDIADKFNISRPSVSNIINQKTWKHV